MAQEKNLINHRNMYNNLGGNVDQNLEKNCKEGQITLTNYLGQKSLQEVNETDVKKLILGNNEFHILPIEKLLMMTLTSSKTRSKFFGSYKKKTSFLYIRKGNCVLITFEHSV